VLFEVLLQEPLLESAVLGGTLDQLVKDVVGALTLQLVKLQPCKNMHCLMWRLRASLSDEQVWRDMHMLRVS
jgi:hypothetical protein